MIDVQDCDSRLPSSGDPNDQYTDEFVRLSILLGRVLKTIYTLVDIMFCCHSYVLKIFQACWVKRSNRRNAA